VTARGPFAVGSVLWRDARGKLVCTLVAKATYALVPGESVPLDEPLPLQEDDGHWDDDASKSVYVPSDLAPFKQAAEAVIVGSAFAPGERPAARASVRLLVGSIDKSVDVWRARRFRQDGNLEESALQKRFSLRYEHAAGGPGTDNPVGMDIERVDARGRYAVPQIVPATFTVTRRDEFIPSVGLGPIAPTWPPRSAALLPAHTTWLRNIAGSPLPQGFFARYFQAAPADQWLDRPLAANERLVLEGLHPEIPRLVTNLFGVEPRAIIAGTNEEPRRLLGDLLVVDTDRGLCTLTYRLQVPLDDAATSVRVIIVGAPMGAKIRAEAAREMFDVDDLAELLDADVDDETAATITPQPRYSAPIVRASAPVRPVRFGGEPDAVTTTPGVLSEVIRVAALPFSGSVAPTFGSRAALGDGALPFREIPAAPPSSRVIAPPRSEPGASTPPPPALAHPTPAATPPPASAAPALHTSTPPAPALHTPAPLIAWRTVAESAPPFVAPEPPAPPAEIIEPRPARELPREGSPRAFPPPRNEAAATPASAAFGGVKAASDAAAGRENGREGGSPFGARDGAKSAVRRLGVIDLLSFDPKIAARLRTLKRYAPIFAQPARPSALQGVDAPRADAPDRERADVLRVLSFGTPVSASEVRNALADSLDDPFDLDPPFVLVAGELRALFDEVETLRAAVAIARPVAGGDKKLLATLAIAEESLASPIPPRFDTALGLSRQIEQASTALSLPPRYVASEVERVLLEGRKYKRRTLLGAPRVRAELLIGREGASFPFYVLDSVAASLPLLPSCGVTALCEVRPREDVAETQNEALFAVALGRVLHWRNEG
jgi:hypothetical protein